MTEFKINSFIAIVGLGLLWNCANETKRDTKATRTNQAASIDSRESTTTGQISEQDQEMGRRSSYNEDQPAAC